MKRVILLILVLTGLFVFSSTIYAIDISGKTYIQYTYCLSDGIKGHDSFSIERTYLNFKQKVHEKVDFRITTELSGGEYKGKDNYYVVYIKYAYVTFKDIIPNSKLIIGQAGRPWIGFVEKIWEHRWVSKSFADLEKKLSSTGRGIGLNGKISDFLEYHASFINGAGYHSKESGDYHKDASLRLTLKPIKDLGLKLSGLYYLGYYDDQGLPDNTKNRIAGIVSFQADKFTVAGEILTSDDKGKTGSGYGGFGFFKVSKFTPFARYEFFDPDTDTNNDEHTRIILGVSHACFKNVEMAIDYQSVDYKASAATDTASLYFHIRVKYK